jgi:phosphoribosyl 1,2-cyclic phosphodiesterase
MLGSGSEGNAAYLESGGTRLLLDAGFSCREMEARLCGLGVDPAGIDAILLSHEHGDHARGAERFSRRFGTLVAGTRATLRTAGLTGAPSRRLVFESGERFRIGAFTVATAPLSHDAADPVGFRVEEGERRVGFALDLGTITQAVLELLWGCETVILESNHDLELLERGPYPRELKERLRGPRGHLSNLQAAELLAEAAGGSARTLVLAHLSRTNNRPDLARAATHAALGRKGAGVRVLVAEQRSAGGWIKT